MTAHIVVGTDGSPEALRATDWAISWAAAVDGRVTLISSQPIPPGRGPDSPGLGEKAKATIAAERERLVGSPVEVDARAEVAHPVTALVRASEAADAVVVGTEGAGGWRGGIVGSTSSNVAAAAHCPTVVVPKISTTEFDTTGPLVVGFDGSDAATHVARLAIEAAQHRGRTVRMIQAGAGESSQPEPLDEQVEALRAEFPDATIELETVATEPAQALTEAARDAAFLVVASQGHRGVPGFLLGTTTREVLRVSEKPVIVMTERSKRLWPHATA